MPTAKEMRDAIGGHTATILVGRDPAKRRGFNANEIMQKQAGEFLNKRGDNREFK